jgi:hypothetical protein
MGPLQIFDFRSKVRKMLLNPACCDCMAWAYMHWSVAITVDKDAENATKSEEMDDLNGNTTGIVA